MTEAEMNKLIANANRANNRRSPVIRNSGLNGQTILLIVAMFLSAAGPTLTGMGAWLNSKAAISSAEAARLSNAETASEVKKIHVAVNSERTAMMEKVKEANDIILVLSKELATLREKTRPVRDGEGDARQSATDRRVDQNAEGLRSLMDELRHSRTPAAGPTPVVEPARQGIVETKVDKNTEGLKELLEELKQYRSKVPVTAGDDAGKPALRTTEK